MKSKRLSNIMLIAAFVSDLLYAMSYPYIYAETIKVVPKLYISIEQVLACIGAIVVCRYWNRHSDELFRHYRLMLWIEIIADTILFADVLIRWNLSFYFMFNVIIYSIITRNLMCGGTKMRAKLNPTEHDREQFDNNNQVVRSAATLLGAGTAIILNFNLRTLFVLALIGNTIDNVFYLYIYRRLKSYEQRV